MIYRLHGKLLAFRLNLQMPAGHVHSACCVLAARLFTTC